MSDFTRPSKIAKWQTQRDSPGLMEKPFHKPALLERTSPVR
jgi:hypothetical protein